MSSALQVKLVVGVSKIGSWIMRPPVDRARARLVVTSTPPAERREGS